MDSANISSTSPVCVDAEAEAVVKNIMLWPSADASLSPTDSNTLLLCLGTPAALCAILWVRSTDNVEFQNILSFQLTF